MAGNSSPSFKQVPFFSGIHYLNLQPNVTNTQHSITERVKSTAVSLSLASHPPPAHCHYQARKGMRMQHLTGVLEHFRDNRDMYPGHLALIQTRANSPRKAAPTPLKKLNTTQSMNMHFHLLMTQGLTRTTALLSNFLDSYYHALGLKLLRVSPHSRNLSPVAVTSP